MSRFSKGLESPFCHVPRWTPENRRRANRALIESLMALWNLIPDQRFGQLVMNLSRSNEGFEDTWNWDHQNWFNRIAEAQTGWAKRLAEPDDRSYATYNGFYIGDDVELPDGRRGCIDEIIHKQVHGHEGDTHSVVRIDDELWLDGWLTRV